MQLLAQVDKAIAIFDKVHPGCEALLIFDQSLAHASLGLDALCAFDMNKSNGGKQRKQKDTVIPINNLHAQFWGKPQKMTTEAGEAKGLKQVLEEHSFDVTGMVAKCSLVCPFENDGCCMACLLSKQDDFHLQTSLLQQKIEAKGHKCVFLPKFHCKLNPIEMVYSFNLNHFHILANHCTQYWGWCKQHFRDVPKNQFDVAKKVTRESLDACPVGVI